MSKGSKAHEATNLSGVTVVDAFPRTCSLDHVVRPHEHLRWKDKAGFLGRLENEHQLKLGRLLLFLLPNSYCLSLDHFVCPRKRLR